MWGVLFLVGRCRHGSCLHHSTARTARHAFRPKLFRRTGLLWLLSCRDQGSARRYRVPVCSCALKSCPWLRKIWFPGERRVCNVVSPNLGCLCKWSWVRLLGIATYSIGRCWAMGGSGTICWADSCPWRDPCSCIYFLGLVRWIEDSCRHWRPSQLKGTKGM